MSLFEEVRTRSQGEIPGMLDLSLWHVWHQKQGSLPAEWRDSPLEDIAADLVTPVWKPARVWDLKHEGIEMQVEEADGVREVHFHIRDRRLTAKWTKGPDGDWWQLTHLIDGPEDFAIAIELAASRRLTINEDFIAKHSGAPQNPIDVLELPRRPFSDLLHDYLGWGEGTLMLRDCETQVEELLSVLDAQLHALIQDLVSMPASIFFSPDNLDGQYISPRLFEQYLQASYTQSNEILSKADKSLVVQVGGPMRQLVEPLAQCGVDAVEGVSGHPQSDVEIPQARKLAGREITLWGGIPQDWLLENTEFDDFEQGVRVIFNQAAEDGNTIVGVADRVPAAAELDRLKLLARWLAESS